MNAISWRLANSAPGLLENDSRTSRDDSGSAVDPTRAATSAGRSSAWPSNTWRSVMRPMPGGNEDAIDATLPATSSAKSRSGRNAQTTIASPDPAGTHT